MQLPSSSPLAAGEVLELQPHILGSRDRDISQHRLVPHTRYSYSEPMCINEYDQVRLGHLCVPQVQLHRGELICRNDISTTRWPKEVSCGADPLAWRPAQACSSLDVNYAAGILNDACRFILLHLDRVQLVCLAVAQLRIGLSNVHAKRVQCTPDVQ